MNVLTFWAVLVLAALGFFVVVVNGRALVHFRKSDPRMRAHYTRQLAAAVLLGSSAVLVLVGLVVGRWLVLVGGLLAAVGFLGYFVEQYLRNLATNDYLRVADAERGEPTRDRVAPGRGIAIVLSVLMAAASIGYFLIRT